jgi:tRNA (guanosine-2'-O-)-methyltransferase
VSDLESPSSRDPDTRSIGRGRPITERRLQRMRAVLERRQPTLAVVLENVHDRHNASAVLRSCDAFGVGAVHLLYTEEAFPLITDSVAGHAQRWLALERWDDRASFAAALRERGITLYATAPGPDAVPPTEVDWTQPAAIALGNENRGCSEELLALADARVWIPMRGMVESLNVSVAAATVLAEAARQREAAGMYAPRWDDEREHTLLAWLARERRERPPPAEGGSKDRRRS